MRHFPLSSPELLTPALASEFTRPLLGWFAENQRPLPWRTTYTPYHVWLSEIMLQQTQMERGVTYFRRWLQELPDIASVAAAHEDTLLRLWEGLGYYSRARNLHRAARVIMDVHSGVFPSDVEAIRALPGIGPYTAAAIASIAFQQDIPCIDANVGRVLARVFDIDSVITQEPAAGLIRRLSELLLPPGSARAYNQAMMEFGALICGKKPRCSCCPLSALCQSQHLGIVSGRPVLPQRASVIQVEAVTGVLQSGDRIFIQKRLDSDVWGGLWEFPGGKIEPGESPEQAIVREYMEETGFPVRVLRKLTVIRHAYTRYRITLHCFALELDTKALRARAVASGEPAAPSAAPAPPVLTAASAFLWEAPDRLVNYGQPAAHRKLADMLFGADVQLSLL